MQTLKIFSIYDKKAVAYNQPYFFPQTGQALRAFADLVNDNTSPLCRHPEDFALFHIGEYNDNTGVITPVTPNPIHIEEALNVKNKITAEA